MSFELTPGEMARVLERLLVFKTGFMAHAAGPVCADAALPAEKVEAAVAVLAGEGALTREDLPTGAVRYNWSEEYTERSGNVEGLEDSRPLLLSRAEWFVGYLQEIRPNLSQENQKIWLDQVELDHENICAAVEWALAESPDPNMALDLCIASFRYWYVHCHFKEGSQLTLEAINRVPMRQDRNKLRALNNAALLLEAMADLPRSGNALRNALVLARALGDKPAEAAVLINLATNARDLGDFPEAKKHHQEAIELLRSVGDRVKLIPALSNYAATKLDFRDTSDVSSLLDEAEALAVDLKEEWGLAFIAENRGQLAEVHGDFEGARAHYKNSLQRYGELDDAQNVARVLKSLAELAVSVSLFDRAATLFGAAELARESCNAQVPPVETDRAIVAITNTRGALGEDAFKKAYGIGHMMRLDEAVRYASANA